MTHTSKSLTLRACACHILITALEKVAHHVTPMGKVTFRVGIFMSMVEIKEPSIHSHIPSKLLDLLWSFHGQYLLSSMKDSALTSTWGTDKACPCTLEAT